MRSLVVEREVFEIFERIFASDRALAYLVAERVNLCCPEEISDRYDDDDRFGDCPRDEIGGEG